MSLFLYVSIGVGGSAGLLNYFVAVVFLLKVSTSMLSEDFNMSPHTLKDLWMLNGGYLPV